MRRMGTRKSNGNIVYNSAEDGICDVRQMEFARRRARKQRNRLLFSGCGIRVRKQSNQEKDLDYFATDSKNPLTEREVHFISADSFKQLSAFLIIKKGRSSSFFLNLRYLGVLNDRS